LKGSINKSYAELIVGKTIFAFWWKPRMWGLSFHSSPCCRLYIEVGPFELMR
jgi:hypothetical protein